MQRYLSSEIFFRENKEEEGECSLFGKQVAATLQRLPPQKRALAKIEIDKVLFSIEFEQ